ncbi:hypothetical protein ACVMIH_007465 [Bradyrhizobium sp. USDA 4503]
MIPCSPMRPKKPKTTGPYDLFRARGDQTTNVKHELGQLVGKNDWEWIDWENRATLQRMAGLVSEPSS